PTDLKEVDFGPSKSKISADEMSMSAALLEQFSDDFEPERFTDEYQAEQRRLLEAKLEEGETVDSDATFGQEHADEASEEGGTVIGLVDALERSVRGRRDAAGTTEDRGAEKKSSGSRKTGGARKGTATKKSG